MAAGADRPRVLDITQWKRGTHAHAIPRLGERRELIDRLHADEVRESAALEVGLDAEVRRTRHDRGLRMLRERGDAGLDRSWPREDLCVLHVERRRWPCQAVEEDTRRRGAQRERRIANRPIACAATQVAGRAPSDRTDRVDRDGTAPPNRLITNPGVQ